ncbi:MAG: tRNA (adenosine(37)-N6)-threonylcarbamoyltransferase complex dimerization subunit type 1 TsaB [Candidatus Eremiobacteraeota bacterium]|nr:tRNA (adenosine(37)-N6)-threonylcarbamoyltransferase complex dimerization subunit type 1 TsaB [Candidatus Eremiobacteraeota bacterium]
MRDAPPASWLGIDGALGGFSAALVVAHAGDRGATLTRTERIDGKRALESGLALIESVLGETLPGELTGVAVVNGPGSFTGLRIALSYAKSLAFAATLPLVAVSSYDAYEPPQSEPPSACFVHGRSSIGCVRLRLGSELSTICGTYAEIAAALAGRIPPGELRAYGAAEGAAAALGERGIIVRPMPPFAQTPALAVALRALGGAPRSDPHAVDADYGEAHYAERSTGGHVS